MMSQRSVLASRFVLALALGMSWMEGLGLRFRSGRWEVYSLFPESAGRVLKEC